MSKEQTKRDKNGRFAKKSTKVEMEITVEEPKFKNTKEELEYWKTLAEGYKGALEDIGSKYLNARKDIKDLKAEIHELKSYERHWKGLLDTAKTWKKRAQKWEEKCAAIQDVVDYAYIYIGWYRMHLSKWTKWRHKEDILNIELDLDNRYANALYVGEE